MDFTILKNFLARASVFHAKSKKVLFLMFMQNILHWRAQERARKCARAKKIFRIVKCMKFATFYVFEIFSYRLNWLLWMALKCVLFFEFFKKKLIFLQNFQILKILRKNRIFKKKIQTSNCSKKFAFWVMTKQKNLQRDFIIKITFPKKFLARAHFRARRAPNLTSLWKLKNHGFWHRW